MEQILGMGDARGRWREQLELAGHPVLIRDDVDALVWRRRLGIRGRGEAVKAEAVRWVAPHARHLVTDHNEAEGMCLAAFGVLDGLHRVGARLVQQQVQLKARRIRARQLRMEGT